MGATRNAVLSVAAAGLLIVGLLVLIPEPVQAVKPLAPTVSVSNPDGLDNNNIKTTLTTQVLIPAGSLIPITYAEIIVADGTLNPSFDPAIVHRMNANLIQNPCVATILSVTGAEAFGNLRGYGYDIGTNGYGYGYEFTDNTEVDVLGQPGYGYGEGYGYGSATKDSIVTVTLEASNCPSGSAFTSTFRAFYFQAVIGGSQAAAFASLPTLLNVRDPEATFPTVTSGNTDTTPELIPSILDSGSITTYGLQFQAGTSIDGLDYASGSILYTPDPNQVSTATTLTSALLTTNQPVPDGATVSMAFFDLDSTGGTTFPSGSTAFGIPAADLATRTGGAALAGFFSITMSGLPAGSSPGAYIDILATLDIPTSYFTGGLTTANFHLERYSDAGVYQGTVPCTFVGAGPASFNGATNRFTCNITDFSSFAMVASAITGGGGGGGGVQPTSTSTATGTGTGTSTGTGTGTGTSTGGKGKGGSAPGLEFGLLVGALAGIAFLARRKLK